MYTIYIGFLGINYYVVYKDGKEVLYTWCCEDVERLTGLLIEDIERIY